MAAVQQNADAQNCLREMYQYGYGISQNDVEAVKWYQKTANGGSANGQFRLGWMYEKGRGSLPRDKQIALLYYKMAAESYSADLPHILQHCLIILQMRLLLGALGNA